MPMTIARNVGILFIADLITNALSLGLTFFIARAIGAQGLGQYSFAMAFASLFIVFSEFGTLTFFVKEVSADKAKAALLVRNMAFLKLVFGLLTLLFSIVAIWIADPAALPLVALASVAMFFNYFGYLFRAVFQAYERMEYDAATRVIERLVAVCGGIVVLVLGLGVKELIITQVVSYGVFFVVSWVAVSWKFVSLWPAFDFALCKKILVASIPFWLTSVFIYVYFRIDTVMLSLMTNYEQVGWYNAAYKLLEALAFFQTAVLVSVFPVFSRLYAGKKLAELRLLFSDSIYYLYVFALPLCVGGALVAPGIIAFIYGNGFVQSVIALRILFVALFFLFVNYIMGVLLNATNRGYQFTIAVALAAVFNVAVNFWAIPRYGYIGASWITVLTEVVNALVLLFLIMRAGFSLPIMRALRPTVAAMVMAVPVLFLPRIPLIVMIPLAGVVYAIVLVAVRGVGAREFALVRGMLK